MTTAAALLLAIAATSAATMLPHGRLSHPAAGGRPYRIPSTISFRGRTPDAPKCRQAVAVLSGGFGLIRGVSGVVTFEEGARGRGVVIRGSLSGLPPKACLAMHVHTGGNLADGCVSVGHHWNPLRVPHGPPTEVSHAGDFGNLVTDSRGAATFSVSNVVLSALSVDDLLGRAFVVHESVDDLGYGGQPNSLKDGNSGRRVACGVIGRA